MLQKYAIYCHVTASLLSFKKWGEDELGFEHHCWQVVSQCCQLMSQCYKTFRRN